MCVFQCYICTCVYNCSQYTHMVSKCMHKMSVFTYITTHACMVSAYMHIVSEHGHTVSPCTHTQCLHIWKVCNVYIYAHSMYAHVSPVFAHEKNVCIYIVSAHSICLDAHPHILHCGILVLRQYFPRMRVEQAAVADVAWVLTGCPLAGQACNERINVSSSHLIPNMAD